MPDTVSSVHYLPIDQVAISDTRQRREFPEEAHAELQRSISTKGLLHPPILRRRPDNTFELVAGERRFRAISALHKAQVPFFCNGVCVPAGAVPFLLIHELDPVLIEEAELEENVIRQDLTIQEQIKARARLFEMRKSRAHAAGKEYEAEDLALELQAAGVSHSSVRSIQRQLSLAAHIDSPEVAKATTLADVAKAAKKNTEKFLTDALAGMVGAIDAPPPEHKLLVGDSKSVLLTLPSETFDCVLTDPPYGIGIDDSGSMVENTHHYDDSPQILMDILAVVPQELFRVTKPLAHVYWFCDPRWFTEISMRLADVGFEVWHRPIIWHKRGKSMVPDMTKWPRQTCEWIVYAIKGGMPTLKVADDLISTPYTGEYRQAEKPKELLVELLSRSVMQGGQILDPFAGSGSIFNAARELKLHAVGIEQDEERANLARIRATGEL